MKIVDEDAQKSGRSHFCATEMTSFFDNNRNLTVIGWCNGEIGRLYITSSVSFSNNLHSRSKHSSNRPIGGVINTLPL